MKIIILKKVKGLGDVGHIKEVSDGYAINFLIPQKIAQPATESNINRLNKSLASETKQSDQDFILAQKKFRQLTGVIIEIQGQCNGEGKLYSAIGANTVVDKLKEKGIDIESRQINLTKPIKELGKHSVFIVLNHELESKITVVVTE